MKKVLRERLCIASNHHNANGSFFTMATSAPYVGTGEEPLPARAR
jgi:hypothetical protein